MIKHYTETSLIQNRIAFMITSFAMDKGASLFARPERNSKHENNVIDILSPQLSVLEG